MSDPWSRADYQKTVPLISALSARWERKVLASADALVFPTEALARIAAEIAPDHGVPERSHVIPHVFDRRLYNGASEQRAKSEKRCFIIRHFGNFYGLRRAEPLIEAIRILVADDSNCRDQLRLEFFGRRLPRIPLYEDRMLGSIIKYCPRVDHVDALQLMASADLLAVIDGSSHTFSPYLPAKLIDYLGAATRVLAVCGPGETSLLTRRAGGLVASADDPLDIARAIRTAMEEHSSWRPRPLLSRPTMRPLWQTSSGK